MEKPIEAQARIGYQCDGWSPIYTKKMALKAKHHALGQQRILESCDVGAGGGELSRMLLDFSDHVTALDFYPPPTPLEKVDFIPANLNQVWPVQDCRFDFAFSLEVIEHVENPRHFMREMRRILKPGGHLFLTTPNNHSLTSILTFILKGQHRFFQNPSYPAHITALLQIDILRIVQECNLEPLLWLFSNTDSIPLLHWRMNLPGRLFSDCLGLLVRKP